MTRHFSGSYCNAIAAAGDLQGRLMWCDAEANLWELCTRKGVADTVARCRDANINAVIVDVKPLNGMVLYNSRIAPHLPDWDDKPYPQDYDLLQAMVEECHKAGISIYAAINVFSEGSQDRTDGPAHKNPDWQCIKYELDSDGNTSFVRVADSEAEHLAVFVNPARPEPREYELAVIDEIIRNYDVDGIVLDRMRYPNIYADFSDYSRESFEDWMGEKVARWPEDIFKLKAGNEIAQGPLFSKWLEWRASVITSFLEEARLTVKRANSKAILGVYTGSWYSEYYGVGVNWGSRDFRLPYKWASEDYHNTGFAHLVDYLCTGCYYEHATREEARGIGMNEELTVEAAGETSVEVTMDDTFVYGSLYLKQYEGDPEAFARAVDACLDTTEGFMIFDLVYVRDYDWWHILKNAFDKPADLPHEIPGLRAQVKDTRRLIDKWKSKRQ